MFSIAGYDLAEDKIIYLWDVKRHERAIDVEKERKAKEAAFSSRARRITFIKLRETCIARRAACAAQTVASWLPGCRVQQAPPLLPPSAPPRRAAPRIMPMRFSRRWAPSRRQLGQSVGRSSSIVRCDGVATATTQHASIYPSTLPLSHSRNMNRHWIDGAGTKPFIQWDSSRHESAELCITLCAGFLRACPARGNVCVRVQVRERVRACARARVPVRVRVCARARAWERERACVCVCYYWLCGCACVNVGSPVGTMFCCSRGLDGQHNIVNNEKTAWQIHALYKWRCTMIQITTKNNNGRYNHVTVNKQKWSQWTMTMHNTFQQLWTTNKITMKHCDCLLYDYNT